MNSSEEEIITKYLIRKAPNEHDKKLYRQALGILNPTMNPQQLYSWNFAMNHPRLLPFLDAGLKLIETNSPIRMRIYIFLAILETNPNHSSFFLQKNSRWRIIKYPWFILRGFILSVIGTGIVKILNIIYNYRHGKTA